MIALDASALLAFLFSEGGHEQVTEHLTDSCMSAVNLAEVLGRFARDGIDPLGVLRRLEATPIELVPFDSEDAARVAALFPLTRHLGLSLGDRACLALAISRDIPALTTDRTWERLDIGVDIQVVRRT
ncbi:MAG TPA: type II toxin-antitoxin system VapC family toxin [Gemmatimonadota bacterium]|nr:type II toxin-antitoxin system VapC family toxin [Gemmatimonadota bacterium]